MAAILTIPGYDVTEELSRNDWHALYRGSGREDKEPVLLKVPRQRSPGEPELALLQGEYEFLREIAVPGVLRVQQLLWHDGACCLVLGDRGGMPLPSILPRHPSLEVFFKLALPLCSTLAELHRRDIILNCLNPRAVLYNPGDEGVSLADFTLASKSSAETQSTLPPHLLSGILPYISPEQTGRMNRPVDYRTDFYSLGITFYEILTGSPPFISADPLELMHFHIAKTAVPLGEVRPEIPGTVSDIIAKLLAKTAEDRYQSALGLKEDLEQCARELCRRRSVVPFPLARHDVSDRFLIPQKLYGREEEVKQLLEAYDEAGQGPTAMMLVSGYSGIGKTSLIQELYKPIVRERGYFISGKFDQVLRSTPFGALIQALRGLVRLLLTESEDRLALWRKRLLAALGSNTGVLSEVVPEIALILGELPPAPPLAPTEAQNRFRLVFQNLIGALARKDHHLVIFLDDLQWADPATLTLLQTLLTGPGIQHLFLIGAYRDNEVSGAHPLAGTIDTLEASGARLRRILLGSLKLADVTSLIQETLHGEPSEVRSLARLVMQKTDGNPFFVRQFLKSLRQEGYLRFNYDKGCWTFAVDEIVDAAMTDNVIDLMTRKIQKLSPRTQQVLTMAACIGNPFDLNTLAIVSRLSPDAAARELADALEEGLIISTAQSGATYSFLHDRVQQAAYALIPAEGKQLVHLTAGRLLRDQRNPAPAEEKLFDVVEHLNLGSALMTDGRERLALAHLNLTAGRKAKTSTAYQAALGYLNSGVSLLGDDRWKSDYELMLALYLEAAECEYLCGHFERANQYFEVLLKRAATRLDKARVHCLRVVLYENMSRYEDAVSSGKVGIALFDIALPETAEGKREALESKMQAIEVNLAGRSIDSLFDLPVMANPEIRMAMKILTALWAPTYLLGDQLLTRVISAMMVHLSLIHGNAEESAYGYVTHAITVGPVMGDYKSAYEFGSLALRVNERLNDHRLRAKVHQQFNAHVNLWRQPLQTCIPHAREACRSGLEMGDFTYANYGAFTESWSAFLTSRNLAQFVRDYLPNLELIKKLRMSDFVEAQKVILNWARALQGLTSSGWVLSAADFDEDAYARAYESNPFLMVFYHIAKLHLYFNSEQYEKALQAGRRARSVIGAAGGTIWPVLLDFWSGLTSAFLIQDSKEGGRDSCLEELSERRRSIAALAENCPENYQCYHLMLAAETERITGDPSKAADFYEQAISYAAKIASVQQEALANELFAKFWLRRNNDKAAAAFLGEARLKYVQWGASAKASDLQERYCRLLEPLQADAGPPVTPVSSPLAAQRGPEQASLEISTALKAAHAIADEIESADLLKKLMKIALENAGAQRALFLQEQDGRFCIRAEGSVDHVAWVGESVSAEEPVKFSQAVVRYVSKTGESIVIGDAGADQRFAADSYIEEFKPRSVLCVALAHQGKVEGMLYLENNLTTEAFTSDRIEMMRIISAQAAISLEKARLYEEMKQEVARRQRAEERNRTLLQINNAIITRLAQKELFHAISEALLPVVNFDRSALMLYEPEKDILRLCALEGHFCSEKFKIGTIVNRQDSHAGWVFDHMRPLLRRDLAKERQYTPEHLLFAEGIRSLCTAPLLVRGKSIGTLSVLSERANQYSESDAQFLQEVANQVALAVENMKAYEEISALKARLEAENVYLQEEIRQEHNFVEIVGRSPALLDLLRQVEKVAPTDSSVLIYGETGTGKELIARAIHNRSNRKDRPLVKVNCGSIPGGLVESELFGHIKGAFTGAVENRVGRFELADGGTLFLDEVSELPLETQVKLLRVLQEQEFEPVGSSRTVRVDVRIIAASNRDLADAVGQSRFRADLYYRLNVFPLTVPPLRVRKSDIPLLVTFFLPRYAKEIGKHVDSVSQDTMNLLVAYTWPGNIRELQNVLQRAIVLSTGPVLTLEQGLLPVYEPAQFVDVPAVAVVPASPASEAVGTSAAGAAPGAQRVVATMEEAERRHILAVLEQTGGVIEGPRGAAAVLDLHPNTLRSRMKKLDIHRQRRGASR